MQMIKNKIIVISIIIVLMSLFIFKADASSIETYDIEIKMLNENTNHSFYVLLPENYIEYAIQKSNLNIIYAGASTLKEFDIPGIKVSKDDIKDEEYQENEIEYVQILLTPDSEVTYHFSVIADYPNMDIKFRITSDEQDSIMHIDNFKVQDGVCKIEYDSETKTFKNIIKIKGKISLWQVVVVVLILLVVWYILKKRSI